MQPAAESRFDCAEHISQRSLGVAMNPGLGGSVFPKVNCGQGYSFQGRSPKYIQVSYRSVSLGYGIAAARTKGAAVLSQAGAPLSWTRERADTFFVCERLRKAAANERQPPRAERAMQYGGSRGGFPLRATTK